MGRDAKEWWNGFTPLSHLFKLKQDFLNKQNKGDDYKTLIRYVYNVASIRLWS